MALNKIKQGDIWKVNFNPQMGGEITKIRPAIVISSDALIHFDIKIIVPVTSWQTKFELIDWLIVLDETNSQGLQHKSAANCFQVKSFSTERFVERLGSVNKETLMQISLQLCSLTRPNLLF